MAKITITSDTATRDVTFDLPHNARIVVVDDTTKNILYSIGVDGARKLIFTDDLTVVACEPDTGEKDTWLDEICDDDTCNADDAEDDAPEDDAPEDDACNTDDAPKDDTSEDNIDANTPQGLVCEGEHTEYGEYAVHVTRNANGELFNPTTNRPMSEEEFVNLVVTAERHNADCAMTFDIPGRSVTTFAGTIHRNYSGWGMDERPGFSIVGNQGGSLIVDEEMHITQDVTVLTSASVIFSPAENENEDATQDNTASENAVPETDTFDNNPYNVICNGKYVEGNYVVNLIRNTEGKLINANTNRPVTDTGFVNLMVMAEHHSARSMMTFDTPGGGRVTFVGKIRKDYTGPGVSEQHGLSVVGNQSGYLVVDELAQITEHVATLTKACITFTPVDTEDNNTSANVDTNINTDDIDVTTVADDTPTIDEAEQARIEAAPVIEEADGKISCSVDVAKLTDNSFVLLRETLKLASYKQLSVIVTSRHDERIFVGKGNYDNDDDVFALQDNTNGVILVRVDNLDTLRDSGIETVEIFSDSNMRRNGFAGLNNSKYAETPLIAFLAHMEA